MNKKISGILLVGSLLTSCTTYQQSSINPPSLPSLCLVSSKNDSAPENVEVYFKVYSTDDSMRFLGKNLIKENVQPIQVEIINHSDKTLIFSEDNFSLPTLPEVDIVELFPPPSKGNHRIPFMASPLIVTTTFLCPQSALIQLNPWFFILFLVQMGAVIGHSASEFISVVNQDPSIKIPFLQTLIKEKSPEITVNPYVDRLLRDQLIAPHASVDGVILVQGLRKNSPYSLDLVDHHSGKKLSFSSKIEIESFN